MTKKQSMVKSIFVSLANHSATVAQTVAQDFESSCVSGERPVFNMVAGEGFEPPTFGL